MSDLADHRLSKRLSLDARQTEQIFERLARIDAAKTVFSMTGKLTPQTIDRLTQSVIVTSTGASNRIEGNRLSDDEVSELYRNLRVKKFRTTDEQEVAGYIDMLSRIFASYADMSLSESLIMQLHRDMLIHSVKDERQRGNYKFGSNRVEAKDQSGKVVGIVFDPTPPHLTPIEMRDLLDWYARAKQEGYKHPLLRLANFIFEFLAIHPFQDGNGRSSRLLTNLVLLQEGYSFASVVSHERIVEASKADYYLALNRAQKTWKTDHEQLFPWLDYFTQVMAKQADQALALLEQDHSETMLSDKQRAVWNRMVEQVPHNLSRKELIEFTGFPPRTVETIIDRLIALDLIERVGLGRGTRYRVKPKNGQT